MIWRIWDKTKRLMARLGRFERPTYGSGVRRSIPWATGALYLFSINQMKTKTMFPENCDHIMTFYSILMISKIQFHSSYKLFQIPINLDYSQIIQTSLNYRKGARYWFWQNRYMSRISDPLDFRYMFLTSIPLAAKDI